MERHVENSLRSFFLELLVYAAFVAVYFLAVLHLLGNWLNQLFERERRAYAVISVCLIIGQGFLLELCTRRLLAWIKPRSEVK